MARGSSADAPWRGPRLAGCWCLFLQRRSFRCSHRTPRRHSLFDLGPGQQLHAQSLSWRSVVCSDCHRCPDPCRLPCLLVRSRLTVLPGLLSLNVPWFPRKVEDRGGEAAEVDKSQTCEFPFAPLAPDLTDEDGAHDGGAARRTLRVVGHGVCPVAHAASSRCSPRVVTPRSQVHTRPS